MTREGTRLIAVFIATVLAAAFLSACGGSDSTTTSGSTSAEATSQDGGENSSGQGGSQAGEGANDASSKGGSGSPPAHDVATPLKVSGGGSEQFRSKGGDNSIQEFGEESGESELEEAAEAVHSFFVARAEGEWKSACEYLSKSMLEQLEQLAQSSTELEDKRCPSFLEAFTTTLSDAVWREVTTVDAGSLRQDGEQAFLIYYGAPDKTVYAMPLAVEDGEFKVGALSGNALN